jgi:hypothetical protein
MRQRAASPAASPLQTLIDAIPDEALRPLCSRCCSTARQPSDEGTGLRRLHALRLAQVIGGERLAAANGSFHQRVQLFQRALLPIHQRHQIVRECPAIAMPKCFFELGQRARHAVGDHGSKPAALGHGRLDQKQNENLQHERAYQTQADERFC